MPIHYLRAGRVAVTTNQVQTKTPESPLGIILLCIALILHFIVFYLFVVGLASLEENQGIQPAEEIIILELVYGVLFSVGLALRQDWARLGLLFNAYFLLVIAVIANLNDLKDPVSILIQKSSMFEFAIVLLLHSPPLRNTVKRKSVAQSYIYTSKRDSSESSIPPIISQTKESTNED